MRKASTSTRSVLAALGPLGAVVGIDSLSKSLALREASAWHFGPVGIELHQNFGMIFGIFSEVSPILRVVSLSTAGAFLLCLFAMVQFFIPIRSLLFRAGLSLVMGGIVGNVLDRIAHGNVVDFLVLRAFGWSTAWFNFADLAQWMGYGLVAFVVVRDRKKLFSEEDLRRSLWINPRFQLSYCLMLMGSGLGFSLIAGTFSYTYFHVALRELSGGSSELALRYLKPYMLAFGVVTLAFLALLAVLGLLLSHRIAGPLYAFEKFVSDLKAGRKRSLKLRSGDDLRRLEQISETLQELLSKPG